MEVRIDMHVHLLEKNVKAKDVWSYAEEKRLKGLAITEHSEYNPQKAYELLLEEKPENMLLIAGAELNTNIGHVLIYHHNAELYYYEELFKPFVDVKDVIKIAKKKKFLLSIAHPFGFSYDSAGFIIKEKGLCELVKKGIGIEAYNGLIGSVYELLLDSRVIAKPIRVFERLEKSKIANKLFLGKIASFTKKKFDNRTIKYLDGFIKTEELAERAKFVTAGSDAHYANKVGSGLVAIKMKKKKTEKKFLKELIEAKRKNRLLWSGPNFEEEGNILKRESIKISKKEFAAGIKYALLQLIKEKISKIKKKK